MFDVKPFGLLSDGDFDDIKKHKTLLEAKKDKPILYATENDIAGLVVVFLRSVLTSFGLDDYASVFTEVGVFHIRPDVWVVAVQGVPFGVVEVKKTGRLRAASRTEPRECAWRTKRLYGSIEKLLRYRSCLWLAHELCFLESRVAPQRRL